MSMMYLLTMPNLVHSQPAYGPSSVVAFISPAGVATTRSGTSWGRGIEAAIWVLRTKGLPSLSFNDSAKETTCTGIDIPGPYS